MDYKKKYKELHTFISDLYPFMSEYCKEKVEGFLPELKKSEDERISKEIIKYLEQTVPHHHRDEVLKSKEWIAWLEKQENHANFCNKIQIGDKVTRNRDGVLVNLSQLNRVAKKDEKQSEQEAAWSEEDEDMLKSILATCELYEQTVDSSSSRHLLEMQEDWLKSLRPQNTWKPSDEQMQALSNAGNSFRPFEEGHKVLWSLYNDLKKLREE